MPHWTEDDRGVPVLRGGIDTEDPRGVVSEMTWEVRSDDPEKWVTFRVSGYETEVVRLSLDTVVQTLLPDLVGLVIDARKLPFIAQHGPRYPPPGWTLVDGELQKDRTMLAIEAWAKGLGRRDTPFLTSIRMGDGRERLVMEWGIAPGTELDHGADATGGPDSGDGPAGAGAGLPPADGGSGGPE